MGVIRAFQEELIRQSSIVSFYMYMKLYARDGRLMTGQLAEVRGMLVESTYPLEREFQRHIEGLVLLLPNQCLLRSR